MKASFRKCNVVGWTVCLGALIALSAPSSYAQNGGGTLYYGTMADPIPEFGTINMETWERDPIADVMEPDGVCCPPGNPVEPVDSIISRFRGLAYNATDGEMYAVLRGWIRGGDPAMVTLDTDTGQVSEIVVKNTGPLIGSLSWDPVTRLVYSTNNELGNQLGSMDPLIDQEVDRRAPRALGGSYYALAIDPDTGTVYSIGDSGQGSQTLVTFNKDTRTLEQEINVLDDGFFPSAQAMTFGDGELYVIANNTDGPEVVSGPRYGGNELWRVSLDGQVVELLNPNLGRHLDAIEYVSSKPEPPSRTIQPGDVNLDGQVGSGDVVQILARGKYETNQAATFPDGDVDGAPNDAFKIAGGVGPPGDGFVNSGDVIKILSVNLYETGQYASQRPETQGDGNVVVTYDATTGGVRVDAGSPISSFQVESAAGIFTGETAHGLGGPFDVDTNAKIFKATFGDQFSELDLGAVAATGLSESFLLDDLSAAGSLAAGGTFGDQVELNYVPEPSTLVLCLLGATGLIGYWRRRSI